MAYGIVKQSGGYIFADSVPGEGATFSVRLPAAAPERHRIDPGPARLVDPTAGPEALRPPGAESSRRRNVSRSRLRCAHRTTSS